MAWGYLLQKVVEMHLIFGGHSKMLRGHDMKAGSLRSGETPKSEKVRKREREVGDNKVVV